MKTFKLWIKDFFNGRTYKEEDLNRDISEVFSNKVGQRVLSYLIENHMVNLSHTAAAENGGKAQFILGRHLVVHDLMARMDAHQNPLKYGLEKEKEKETEEIYS